MTGLFSWSLGHAFSVLNFLLAVLFVSFILRSKRPPGNTLAWLFFVVLIPYIGIPFYILLSGRKSQTRFQKKKPLYEPNPSVIARQEGAVEKLLAGYGVPPARPGQKAQLIATGEEAYAAITGLIASARERIHLTTFIFAKDPVGGGLMELLEKKADEGVSVRILLDSFGSVMVHHPSFKRLREKGGQVFFFNPVFHLPWRGRTNLRNHRKFLIVDSQKAILGGMNIAKEYMGPQPDPSRWIDLCLAVEGSSVLDMEIIFAEDWKFASGENLGLVTRGLPVKKGAGSPFEPAQPSLGPRLEVSAQGAGSYIPADCPVQVIASGPDVRSDPLYDSLVSLIYQAERRIWIATPYFIPDESLTRALELAARRGVEVRILVPRNSNHFLADLARGTYLRQVLKAGCRVELAEKMLHAKAFLVDRNHALLGSANFDMRSLLLNYEIGVLIRPSGALAALEGWFEGQFQAAGKSDFRVNFFRDLAESVGRVLGPLI
jgi:cardiolipin synthase